MDVSSRPELIVQAKATTVPWFVYNGVHSFAGPVPELMLTQRLFDFNTAQSDET